MAAAGGIPAGAFRELAARPAYAHPIELTMTAVWLLTRNMSYDVPEQDLASTRRALPPRRQAAS